MSEQCGSVKLSQSDIAKLLQYASCFSFNINDQKEDTELSRPPFSSETTSDRIISEDKKKKDKKKKEKKKKKKKNRKRNITNAIPTHHEDDTPPKRRTINDNEATLIVEQGGTYQYHDHAPCPVTVEPGASPRATYIAVQNINADKNKPHHPLLECCGCEKSIQFADQNGNIIGARLKSHGKPTKNFHPYPYHLMVNGQRLKTPDQDDKIKEAYKQLLS